MIATENQVDNQRIACFLGRGRSPRRLWATQLSPGHQMSCSDLPRPGRNRVSPCLSACLSVCLSACLPVCLSETSRLRLINYGVTDTGWLARPQQLQAQPTEYKGRQARMGWLVVRLVSSLFFSLFSYSIPMRPLRVFTAFVSLLLLYHQGVRSGCVRSW